MSNIRKKNQKLWSHLLKELEDFEVQAGWFENTRYDTGTPVAKIAATQNYGAEINNPGGQPYIIDSNTKLAVFVDKDIPFSENLPRTKPHKIVIPPRPFMDNAKKRIQGQEGQRMIIQEILRVFEGRQTMISATERLGAWMQGIIQEEIKAITAPPLKASTIRQRNNQYKSKSKNKSTKPLNASGLMFSTVQHKSGKKGSLNDT